MRMPRSCASAVISVMYELTMPVVSNDKRAGRLVEAGKVGAFVARKAPGVAGARRNDERFLLHAGERANKDAHGFEYMSTFRVIPFDAEHPDDLLPSYMGNSVAHWDGDTLVVDIIGFNDKTWFAGTGTFHSDALHIVERYTRVSKDRIDYEATMEDPNALTKPWVLQSSLMLRERTRLQEYVCAENNLDPDRYEQLLRNGVDFTRN